MFCVTLTCIQQIYLGFKKEKEGQSSDLVDPSTLPIPTLPWDSVFCWCFLHELWVMTMQHSLSLYSSSYTSAIFFISLSYSVHASMIYELRNNTTYTKWYALHKVEENMPLIFCVLSMTRKEHLPSKRRVPGSSPGRVKIQERWYSRHMRKKWSWQKVVKWPKTLNAHMAKE